MKQVLILIGLLSLALTSDLEGCDSINANATAEICFAVDVTADADGNDRCCFFKLKGSLAMNVQGTMTYFPEDQAYCLLGSQEYADKLEQTIQETRDSWEEWGYTIDELVIECPSLESEIVADNGSAGFLKMALISLVALLF